jgi:hypothetical protein
MSTTDITQTAAGLPAPGWYPDPNGHLRWWDGQAWTLHVQAPAPSGGGAAQPATPPAAATPAAPVWQPESQTPLGPRTPPGPRTATAARRPAWLAPREWSRRTLIVVIAIAAVLVLVTGAWATGMGPFASNSGSTAAQTSAPTITAAQQAFAKLSPQQIYTEAFAAARAKGSLHWVETIRGGTFVSVTGSSGATSGFQTATGSGNYVLVRLVGHTVYLRASEAVLVGLFKFPRATAARVAGKWLSVTAHDHLFSSLVGGITLPSVLTQASLRPPFARLRVTTYRGQQVVGIEGQDGTVRATIWVSTATHLPVRYVETRPPATSDVAMGPWGVPVTVTAPLGAIPVATLHLG